jgi:hypothetical protein
VESTGKGHINSKIKTGINGQRKYVQISKNLEEKCVQKCL